MSKRKKALKNNVKNRHLIIKALRENNHIQHIVDKKGNIIALNMMKHYLYQMPYANKEYNREMVRFIKTNMDRQRQIQQKEEVKDNG